MALKKSELYSSLWKSCDELRGGMDASKYKDYVLVLLFVKYVSDKYAGQKDALLCLPVDPQYSMEEEIALIGCVRCNGVRTSWEQRWEKMPLFWVQMTMVSDMR